MKLHLYFVIDKQWNHETYINPMSPMTRKQCNIVQLHLSTQPLLLHPRNYVVVTEGSIYPHLSTSIHQKSAAEAYDHWANRIWDTSTHAKQLDAFQEMNLELLLANPASEQNARPQRHAKCGLPKAFSHLDLAHGIRWSRLWMLHQSSQWLVRHGPIGFAVYPSAYAILPWLKLEPMAKL